LYACRQHGEIADIITSFQYCLLLQVEMGVLFEKKSPAQINPFGNVYHSPSVCIRLVNDRLDLLSLQKGTVVHHAMIGDPVNCPKLMDVHLLILCKPVRYRCSVREPFLREKGSTQQRA